MSNLENMILEITKQAEEEAKKMLQSAQEKNTAYAEKEAEVLARETKDILERAERDGVALKERSISRAKLKARDDVLVAKEEEVEKVFQAALEQLKHLEVDAYRAFVEKVLAGIDCSKETEVLVTKEMKEAFGTEIASCKIAEDTVESGCCIRQGNVIYNNEFSILLEYQREDLEQEILELLFS